MIFAAHFIPWPFFGQSTPITQDQFYNHRVRLRANDHRSMCPIKPSMCPFSNFCIIENLFRSTDKEKTRQEENEDVYVFTKEQQIMLQSFFRIMNVIARCRYVDGHSSHTSDDQTKALTCGVENIQRLPTLTRTSAYILVFSAIPIILTQITHQIERREKK